MSAEADKVLVVDDERDMAESCAFFLRRAGYTARVAFSGAEALQALDEERFSLVISDVKMPRMSGLGLLDEIKQRDPDVEVVLITGFPEIEAAVTAIKNGAFDYLTKPFVAADLMQRVEKALEHHRLKEGNQDFKRRLRQGPEGRRLVYRSPAFAQTVALLEKAARTDASVLIEGESGTGKELLAHHLHDSSRRQGKPFVPVDCATVPENLVESELFGHVKGAFSGAHADKLGLFRVADGGTLFLDEVGELPLPFQSKLLRAIQERQVRPVGSHDLVHVDVRIVCATNRNLQAEVEAGRFRQDLFYRLDVVRIRVPPLRERPEDIDLLAEHFLGQFGGDRVPALSEPVRQCLRAYHWPGNVRQLRNVLERACALGHGAEIRLQDLPDEVREPAAEARSGSAAEPGGGTFQEMKARKVAAIESAYVERLLTRHQGNVTRSAEDAGMSRSAFQKLMQRYDIKSSDFRGQ